MTDPTPRLDGSAPGDVVNQVRTSPPGDLAGNGLAIQATAYSPSGSTSSSPLVSYSTTSYFPARAPVSRTPSTASDVEPRGSSASLSSFGDAASGASASESSFILTADPPLSRAQGGKNSSMRPRDMGVHAQQEPRRRPSTHQFNAISPVMANTCLPPSSSRLMIHRHSSVASRPRNARGMLRRASGRAERDGARGEASTHSGLRPAYRAAVLR